MSKAVTYAIFDSGNLLRSFDREDAACQALERIAREGGPEAADRLLLVAFDEDGNAISDCAPGERIALPA